MSADGSQVHLGAPKNGVRPSGLRRSKVPVPPCRSRRHSRAQIIVLEEGALTGALPIRPAELDQTAVVAQTSGETALQLAERATHRIAMVKRSGADIAQVSVFLGPGFDEQTMAARRLLGSSVLAYASSARGPCELVFVGRWEDRDLRRELWALVESLVAEPGGAKAPIRLRFIPRMPSVAA